MKSHLLLVLCITRTGMLVWGTDCTGTLGVFAWGGASVSPFQPPILLGLPDGASGPLWMLVLRINKTKSLEHPGCTCVWEQSQLPYTPKWARRTSSWGHLEEFQTKGN